MALVLSAVIVLSLAAGLGANTAVFSWIRTVALDPLPVLLAAVALLAGYLPARRAARLDAMVVLQCE